MLKTVKKTLGPLVYGTRSAGWWLRGRFGDRVTVDTPQGRLTVSCRDKVIGRGIYLYRQHEYGLAQRVMAFLRQTHHDRFRGEGTVLDIGANVGVIGIGLLLKGFFARCLAVEPEPLNFSLLTHNVRQNGLSDRFVCAQQAVSDTAGELTFELCPTNFGDHRVRTAATTDAGDEYGESGRTVIRVPANPLDQILADAPADFVDRVELVWIDVQGHEAAVLRGGGRLFSGGVPTVAEVWPYGLHRAGTSDAEFAELVGRYWREFYDFDAHALCSRPVTDLPTLMGEMRTATAFRNLLFVP
jgi:FkbM family methyltransferase